MLVSPVLVLSSIVLLSTLSTVVTGLPEVQVKGTTISGILLRDVNQEFFGGIPFAEPPVGSLRFAPPVVRLDPGVSALNASQYGPACAQGLGFGVDPAHIESLTMSEDCLSLNVLRPSGLDVSESGLVPVMVWVYGGGFQVGAAFDNNGTAFVSRSVERGSPIIYVNVNYRLGAFGFPQGSEAEAGGALNLGNKDVLAALMWVQENIAAFGGDKGKVTIFGVSAGSILISELLLDPKFNLARAAILESGSASSNWIFNASSRERAWKTLISAIPECSGATDNDTFECARRASTETIINATNFVYLNVPTMFPFAPVLDGPGGIIPDLPSRLYAQGNYAHIPFISGTCLDEGTLFIPPSIDSSELLRVWIVSNSTSPTETITDDSPVVNKILELYPNDSSLGSPFGTGYETFGLDPAYKQASAVFGDVEFTALRRELTQSASHHGVKAYAYLFTDRWTGVYPPFFGVPHGCEIPYLFGSPLEGPAAELARVMIDYWVSFAVNLDPNICVGNACGPIWTQYTEWSKAVLQLDSEDMAMIPDTFRKEQVAYLIDNAEALNH